MMGQSMLRISDYLSFGEVDKSHQSLDAALIAQAKQGDPHAFDELIYRHQEAVMNLARRIVADTDAAQDILQEVIIKAYRGLERFRGEASFASWLYRIALNETRAHLRREKRRAQGHDACGTRDMPMSMMAR
jgi:RNA polymerase sigma-70 factor (ECF subfamily)